jgi:hypothetical protein
MKLPRFHLNLLNPFYVYKNWPNISRDFLTLLNQENREIRRVWCAEHGLPLNLNDWRLARRKNIHKGRIAFLIGNGPSVRIDDLEKLGSHITFCCNRFFLAYDQTHFRPTYTVSADRQMITDFGQEIVDRSEGVVFLADENRHAIRGRPIWIQLKGEPLSFDHRVFDYLTNGGATLLVALQIGLFMGIRDFVLYGVDHDFHYSKDDSDPLRNAQGEGNHFIQNYRSGKGWCVPQIEKIEDSFRYCRKQLESMGGSLRNATRGGKLEILPRIELEKVLQEYKR